MKYDEKILRRNSGELAKKIRDLNYKKLQLISLGNSIGTGFSLSDINLPLLERDKILDEEMKKEETVEQWKTRLESQKEEQSYINLPMNQEEYENFVKELVEAGDEKDDKNNSSNVSSKQ